MIVSPATPAEPSAPKHAEAVRYTPAKVGTAETFLWFPKIFTGVEISASLRQCGIYDADFTGQNHSDLVLDADLQSFIRGSIPSTWALELLLLLRKNQRAYTPDQLVLELRATPLLISGCVAQLQKAGLAVAEADGSCRYAPASPALEQLCAKLQQAYEERPMAVINTIMASPNDRLRSFADAFRFTKKDE